MKIRLFDGHCDTAFELWHRGEPLQKNTCHVDLEKAETLGAYAQVFAFCSYAGTRPLCMQEEYLTLPLRKLREEVGKFPGKIGFAATAQEILSLNETGRAAALLSVEGPEVIECDPARLYGLRDQGFSMTTLTWNADNALAGCHTSGKGLTERGRAFVAAAQEAGIFIDVSHLGERSFWDLMDMTRKPILASHSNCRSLCGHTRNLIDDQLRALSQTGGTVGLNLYPPFLGAKADFDTLRAHLEHMLTLCGEAHVALGGDLDGCEFLAAGFSGLPNYKDFYGYLASRGYDEQLLDRIFYRNLLELYERR